MSNTENSVFEQAVRNFLGPIWHLMEDPKITEILVNAPNEVFVETKGKLQKVDAKFPNDDSLLAAITNIAQSVGRRISKENPRLDARLPNGSRFACVIPPCSEHPVLSIRKFTQTKMSFKDYIQLGAITPDAAQFLDICMFLGKNILVSGGTGSGKTTLLSLLCSRIPKGQRIIVIEDARELQINYEHVVRLETQMADAQGKGEVTIKDLLKSSLRLRPDRIIVGEVRSAEAIELLNAMSTGHKGCMGTVHANTPEDALVRMEGLAQSGDSKLSDKALRHLLSGSIDIVLQVSRFSDGSRRVAAISEVRGSLPDGSYDVTPIFEMSRLLRKSDGTLMGSLESTNQEPSFMNEILDNNLPFPRSKFTKQSA